MLKSICLAASLAVVSSATFAQSAEPMGDIIVEIEGASHSFVTLFVEDGVDSFATASVFQDIDQTFVYIVGSSEEDGSGAQFIVNFAYDNGVVLPLEIAFIPNGFEPPYWTSLDGNTAVITPDSIYIDQDSGQVQARFEVSLCRQDEPEAPVDLADCKTASGSLSTDLWVE